MRLFLLFALLLCPHRPHLLDAREPVHARHTMVVTVEPHATRVGVKALESGGNAVDAAVAVGFALAVTHPSAGNLGGGGFMLIRLADGRTTFLDFRETAPERASRNMYLDAGGRVTSDSVLGWRASGVPGTVRGFECASRKYGRKPWAELLRPAIDLAWNGFPVSYGLARSLKSAKSLRQFPESRRIFLKDGAFYEPGDMLVQPELAATLRRILRMGGKEFYEGETARKLASAMAAYGGIITLADLKGYKPVERTPLTGSYRDFGIITAPPPSSGGIGILQMLGILEGTGYARFGAGSAGSIHFMAEAMRRFYADRSKHMGDPDFVHVAVPGLLNRRYIEILRRGIDPVRATPSAELGAGDAPAYENPSTTHYSIVDAEGNAVAVTYTLNSSYGSGVTVPGLGFLLNNEMDDFAAKPGAPNNFGLIQGEANAIHPRKRPLSSMTPTMVTRGGKLYMVLGSPGGPRIISTVLQVLVNVMDFGVNVRDAVEWPRFHHQWQPDKLYLERGFSPDTVNLLRARGYTVEETGPMGEAAAILSDTGWLQGAADPRTEGTAQGY